MRRAPPTVQRPWPAFSTTVSASSRATWPPCTPTPPVRTCSTKHASGAVEKPTYVAYAAVLSIVSTTTGATRAAGQVLPQMQGRLDGIAMRVPVPDGSIVDLVAELRQEVQGPDEINQAFAKAAADATYRGVLEYTEETARFCRHCR